MAYSIIGCGSALSQNLTEIFLFLPPNAVFFVVIRYFSDIKGLERFHKFLAESVSWFQIIANGFKDFQLFSFKKTFLLFLFFVTFVVNK